MEINLRLVSGQLLVSWIIFSKLLFVSANKTSVERPQVHISPTPVVEGADVTFECEVRYDVGVNVKLSWAVPHAHLNQSGRLHEHEDVEEEKVGEHVKNYKGHLTMALTDVTKKDEGEYTCHVVDNSGNHNSKSVTLSVIPSGTHTLRLDVRGYASGSQIPVNPGQNEVHLLVDIIAHPPPKYTVWYDNYMEPITGRGEKYSVDNNATLAKLTIHQPSVYDCGTYTLVVNNGAFNKSVSVILLVEGAPELNLYVDQDQEYCMVNETHEIKCAVFAFPEPNIILYFSPCPDYPTCSSQFSMIPQSQYKEETIEGNKPFHFKTTIKIQVNNTGKLELQACNKFGCASKYTMMLLTDVEDGLAITEKSDFVVEGDNVTLSCGASKYKHNYPMWLKLGESLYSKYYNYVSNEHFLELYENDILSPIKDLNMSFFETNYSYFNKIVIPRVSKNHSGLYVCCANLRNKVNCSRSPMFKLDVIDKEKPVINKSVETKVSVRTGQPVILQCQVTGLPPLNITWFMNGEVILKENDKNIELYEDNFTLIIGGAGLEHIGQYKCKASNRAGTDELIIDIEITETPVIGKDEFFIE